MVKISLGAQLDSQIILREIIDCLGRKRDAAKANKLKQVLSVIIDSLEKELTSINESIARKSRSAGFSKAFKTIESFEKAAVIASLGLFIFSRFLAGDSEWSGIAESYYRVFSKLHISAFGAGVLLMLVAVTSACWRKRGAIRETISIIQQELSRIKK